MSTNERTEAVAQAVFDFDNPICEWAEVKDDPQSREHYLAVAHAILAAADAVDPLRHRDTAIRFPALAEATNAALDEIIGIADEYLGERVEL